MRKAGRTEGRRDGRRPRRKKLPSLRGEGRYGLLYFAVTERPVGHIAGVEKGHPFSTSRSPFYLNRRVRLPRERDVEGAEKIADKEAGKSRRGRGKRGNKGRQAS